jgi:hypothetical protein
MIKLRIISVWVLLTVYGAEILAPALPFADYFLHKKYIEENLCINRDKPELHCHGTCHLKKELYRVFENKNEDPSKKDQSLPSVEIKIYTFFSAGPLYDESSGNAIENKDNIHFYSNFYSYLICHSLFRPPPARGFV